MTRDDLQQLPPETVQVSFLAGQSTTRARFTGTRLLMAAAYRQALAANADLSWPRAPRAPTRSK